ncbi:hypothetical protein WB876_002418 [Vibrio vulnificus]|uniref:protein YgfX n=1 Tax=Vibrio vulnificus TaxID=672 RepID=UPI00163BC367|nr:hypothetical protein [Vibrio vulnificus]QNE02017.1 hypothetical protein H6S61_06415 [Vibrio vulnificus]
MSHTTSVRFVNLNLKASRNALILNCTLCACLVWALLFSPFPLVIFFPLTYLFSRYIWKTGFLYPSWTGAVRVSRSGSVKQQETTRYLTAINRLFLWWFVSVRLNDGQRLLLWRDSCDDVSYRQLQLILTQWKQKRESNDSL